MSTFLKHIELVKPIYSEPMFLNKQKFYDGVDDRLLNFTIKKYMNNKIQLFHDKKLKDAPYEDIIGYLCGYETVETDLDCGGWCDWNTKKIAYVCGGIETILHEVSHAFQADLDIRTLSNNENVLSDSLLMEQQCETMAYYLYNSIYKDDAKPKERFDAYFSIDDVNYLIEWYKEESIQNDLI